MDLRARVGLNVQALRRDRGLSQEELAHRADVHQTYLSGIERGRRNPSVLTLGRIASALEADVEDLLRRLGGARLVEPRPVLLYPPLDLLGGHRHRLHVPRDAMIQLGR